MLCSHRTSNSHRTPRTAQTHKVKQKIDGASLELHSLLAWIYGQKALPFPPHNIPDAHIRTSGSLFSGRSEATGFLRTESLNVLFLRTFFAQAKKVRPRSAREKSLLEKPLFALISSTPLGVYCFERSSKLSAQKIAKTQMSHICTKDSKKKSQNSLYTLHQLLLKRNQLFSNILRILLRRLILVKILIKRLDPHIASVGHK